MSDKDLFQGQGEAAYVHTEVSEVAESINAATFIPETIIETEMPVADAEATQAAFTELMQQAVAESSGDLPPSPAADPPESDSSTPVPSPSSQTGITDSNNSTFNTQQAVLENIDGQSETVKGAAESLGLASEAIEQVQEVLEELQAENSERDQGETDLRRESEGDARKVLQPLKDLSIVAGVMNEQSPDLSPEGADFVDSSSSDQRSALDGIVGSGDASPGESPSADVSEETVIDSDVIDFTGSSEAQLENVDMQNSQQRFQQALSAMTNISKLMHDSAMAGVRKVGNGSDDEPSNDAGTNETDDGPGEASPQEGDTGLAPSSISAPFIPGGTVLSAAISGVAQGSSSSLAVSAGNGDSGGVDEGSESQEEGESGSGDSPDESSGESSRGGLEDLVNDNFPQDIEALFQMVMMESSEDAEQDLKDMADEMNAMNEAKNEMRDSVNEMKKFKSEAAKALREQYDAQSGGQDVTLAYSTLEQAADTTFQLVEHSETLPSEQADGLITQLEEIQMYDDLIADFDADETGSLNALKANIREGISTLREEVLTLVDELSNWSDGETRTLTYNEVVKLTDGTYKTHEVSKTMTKKEAQSLLASMENQITALEGELEDLASDPGSEGLSTLTDLLGDFNSQQNAIYARITVSAKG